jgi:hypothetical protein
VQRELPDKATPAETDEVPKLLAVAVVVLAESAQTL